MFSGPFKIIKGNLVGFGYMDMLLRERSGVWIITLFWVMSSCLFSTSLQIGLLFTSVTLLLELPFVKCKPGIIAPLVKEPGMFSHYVD